MLGGPVGQVDEARGDEQKPDLSHGDLLWSSVDRSSITTVYFITLLELDVLVFEDLCDH